MCMRAFAWLAGRRASEGGGHVRLFAWSCTQRPFVDGLWERVLRLSSRAACRGSRGGVAMVPRGVDALRVAPPQGSAIVRVFVPVSLAIAVVGLKEAELRRKLASRDAARRDGGIMGGAEDDARRKRQAYAEDLQRQVEAKKVRLRVRHRVASRDRVSPLGADALDLPRGHVAPWSRRPVVTSSRVQGRGMDAPCVLSLRTAPGLFPCAFLCVPGSPGVPVPVQGTDARHRLQSRDQARHDVGLLGGMGGGGRDRKREYALDLAQQVQAKRVCGLRAPTHRQLHQCPALSFAAVLGVHPPLQQLGCWGSR
jgi:hypothetical protein